MTHGTRLHIDMDAGIGEVDVECGGLAPLSRTEKELRRNSEEYGCKAAAFVYQSGGFATALLKLSLERLNR
jgi:hypothetical protein